MALHRTSTAVACALICIASVAVCWAQQSDLEKGYLLCQTHLPTASQKDRTARYAQGWEACNSVEAKWRASPEYVAQRAAEAADNAAIVTVQTQARQDRAKKVEADLQQVQSLGK